MRHISPPSPSAPPTLPSALQQEGSHKTIIKQKLPFFVLAKIIASCCRRVRKKRTRNVSTASLCAQIKLKSLEVIIEMR